MKATDRFKKSFLVVLLIFCCLFFLHCKKWKENRYQKLIVGGWSLSYDIGTVGHYRFSYVFTNDGKFYKYSPGDTGNDDCSKDSIEEGPFEFTLTDNNIFIFKTNHIDTIEIESMTKKYFYFKTYVNGMLSSKSKFIKCE